MELKDTVDLMLSDDYKDRFIAEFRQLEIRYDKLLDMMDKWRKGELNFTPTCPMDMYVKQLQGMEMYLDVLYDRAELEGIDLERRS